MSRRQFLESAAVAAAAASLGCATQRSAAPASSPSRAAVSKKILILGGTAFLGPELVEVARARGHVLTLFNRGKTNPQLFPDIEKLHGDRNGQLQALEGRSWDAVIDTSGYVPRIVKLSAELLAPRVQQYVFVSSISVYPDEVPIGIDESYAVQTMPDPTNEQVLKFYGPLKALCEQAAEKAMPGRTTNVRPGLIVGPTDPTDRYTYWPVRVARGGEVLAPPAEDPAQYVDVRDLAAWIIHCVETATVGVYNATGPRERLSMRALLEACKTAAGSDATFTYADAKFLEAQKVEAWSDLPVWTGTPGFASISNARAVAKGLAFRPAAETARDTLGWWRTLPEERRAKLRSGIAPDRERAVLAAWHAKK